MHGVGCEMHVLSYMMHCSLPRSLVHRNDKITPGNVLKKDALEKSRFPCLNFPQGTTKILVSQTFHMKNLITFQE